MSRYLIINDTNLYEEYGALLLDETISTPPTTKTQWQEIDGRINGSLDLTEAITGFPLYNDREGTLELLLKSNIDTCESWLRSYVHGKESTITMWNDPEHEYRGRVEISEIKRHLNAHVVTLSFKGNPYRYLSDGQIMHNAACGYEFTCVVCDKPVMPTVTVQKNALIRVGNIQSIVTAGTWRIQNAFMTKGENKVYVDTAISDTSTRTLNDIKSMTLESIKNTQLADLRWTSAEKASKTSTTYNAVINWERGEL